MTHEHEWEPHPRADFANWCKHCGLHKAYQSERVYDSECPVLLRQALDTERTRSEVAEAMRDTWKAEWLELDKQRPTLAPKVAPSDVLRRIMDFVESGEHEDDHHPMPGYGDTE